MQKLTLVLMLALVGACIGCADASAVSGQKSYTEAAKTKSDGETMGSTVQTKESQAALTPDAALKLLHDAKAPVGKPTGVGRVKLYRPTHRCWLKLPAPVPVAGRPAHDG